jgi:hypothetical protein
MHSFKAIADGHDLDSSSAQHFVPPASEDIPSLSCAEVPAAVLFSADASVIPEESRLSADTLADSASSFPFLSGDASVLPHVASSVSSESLVSEVQSEGATEDNASAFAFLTS